jgi:hypothetical protein
VSIKTKYCVKYGDPDALWPEFKTRSYIFDYAQSNPHPDAPRIPRVVHYFGDGTTSYLVTEFITLTADSDPLDLIDRMAQALIWLSSIPPPPNHAIGPLGNGYIRHGFFQHYTAPLLFSSVEALQRYMRRCDGAFISSSIHRSLTLTCDLDQAYTLLPCHDQDQLSPVEICRDRLMFTQSDMNSSNFGIDQHGKTVLMDFAEIQLLPETFVAHTMFSEKRLAPIATALSLSDSSYDLMAALSWILWTVDSPKLGASTCT